MRKQKRLKKAMALIMSAALLAGTLSACGKGEADVQQTAANETSASALNEAEGKVTLTIGVQTNPLVEDYETNYFTKIIEEQNDVNLEFIQFPADANDMKSKLSMMVSSNSKLPDVLCLSGLDDTLVYEYGSNGVIRPVEEYLDNTEATPYFNKIEKETRDYMFTSTKSPDGHIYGIASYDPWPWNEGSYRMWINENWLENLGLKMPETTDEFYSVLKAFVAGDPNGNGINDEIGLVGAKDGWATNIIPFVMNAFVQTNPDKNYLYVENGRVKAAYSQDEWKQGLEFLHKLLEEGLISPLSFTQDQSQLKALVQQKGGMAGVVAAGSYSTFAAGTALEFDEMQLMEPLKGPNGIQRAAYNPTVPYKVWFVTKDCANVDKAVQVGDWFYNEDASMISIFGEKGVEWDDDPEGCALWSNVSGGTVETSFYKKNMDFWGNLQNKNWADVNPKYRSEEKMLGEGYSLISEMEEGATLTIAPDFTARFNETYKPCFPEEYISTLPYTHDESEKIGVVSADIINFVNEMNAAFIMGTRSLDEWDAYLAELEAMGLNDYLQVVQVAFERTQ
ncbi:extracellular solute-binding protein [Eisenbergiella porci]|uniref:extracellular solute-binding protein n=1 Tax=Eisenbergiella porci TaxID=2652274 RepID=UPI0022E89A69|nr:extracellular solute-binding protein [Eisenbergiella porci]